MDKRYQVFVSSTYADLKDERRHVLQALMEMDCIPAGMEMFPAADEEQWEFIKRVIDDCDYYLLIIGGRYGSTTSDGISYTEKEFDYAVERGLRVVALIHGSPEEIPFGKSEQDPALRQKLLSFKDKAMAGRLVKFWSKPGELPGLVALSLTKTIKAYPAVGWVRASQVPEANVLAELNEARKRNSELETALSAALAEARTEPELSGIADIDSKFTIHGSYKYTSGSMTRTQSFVATVSWREIFALVAPYLVVHPSDSKVKSLLANNLKEAATENTNGFGVEIRDQEFRTITLQLRAYGLVQVTYTKTVSGGMALFWSLTKTGERLMMESRVVREEA